MAKILYKDKAYCITSFSLTPEEDDFMRKMKIKPTDVMKAYISEQMQIANATKKEVESLTEEIRIYKIVLAMVREKFQDGLYPDLDNWALGLLGQAQIRYNQQKKEGFYDAN